MESAIPSWWRRIAALHESDPARSSVFLALVIVCSSLPYVRDLGFYSDDWYYLFFFETCDDQSLWGLIRCIVETDTGAYVRPGQTVPQATLHWAFGLNPTPYHVYNALVHVCAVVLLYLVLQQTPLPKPAALTIPLLWGMLPHYSTDRFWVNASAANLSMVWFFGCFYCIIRLANAATDRRFYWGLASGIAFLLTLLTYEVSLPLIVLSPVLFWYSARNSHGKGYSRQQFFSDGKAFLLPLGAVFLVTFVLKLFVQTRVPFTWQFRTLRNLDLVAFQAVDQAVTFNFGQFGVGLPLLAWRALRCSFGSEFIVATILFAAAVFCYLVFATRRTVHWPGMRIWGSILLLGVVMFGLAYSLFAPGFSFGPAFGSAFPNFGINNRICIAAAVGAAFSIVGMLGFVSSLLRTTRAARRCFCVLVTLFSTSGFAIIQGLSFHWTEAPRQQQAILADIRAHVPALPPNSTLLLDGICANTGPAIVFETEWDTGGALRLLFDDASLRGDVITAKVQVGDQQVSTFMYGKEYPYTYQEGLWVYNYATKELLHLSDSETGRNYFQRFNPQTSGRCPAFRDGYGTATCFYR